MPRTSASLARRIAHKVLLRVYQDQAFADRALAAILNRTDAPPRERALATELVYGVLRHNRKLDFYIRKHSSRRLKKIQPEALAALRIGSYELLFLRTPAHSAVHEAVNLVSPSKNKVRGFTNGVLRELERNLQTQSLPSITQSAPSPTEALAIEHSIPTAIAERVLKRRGAKETEQWAQKMSEAAPFTIRHNRLKTTRNALQTALKQEGLTSNVNPATPYSLNVINPGNLRENLSFLDGEFSVQDIASQLVCHLVDPKPAETIVDLCAAPGGKTTFLAELSNDQAPILAFDLYPGRAGLIEKAKKRLGIQSIETKVMDATNAPLLQTTIRQWANGDQVDKILLDAPCSGFGTLRRNPDMRLKTTDISELSEIQMQLLESAASTLKPGGYLIYSVCTFTREESTQVIQSYLDKYPNYKVVPISSELLSPFKSTSKEYFGGEYIQTWTDLHHCDGFFAIKLQKSA